MQERGEEEIETQIPPLLQEIRFKKRHKNDGKDKKKCRFCKSLFSSTEDYLLHIETVHQTVKTFCFICSMCGKQFKTKSELTQHISSKCGTLKRFSCEICHLKLMSAGSLYNHMLRHNGERSYMCRYCAKLFITAGQLKVHERIHTQERAYVCEVCNKSFCHRQSLITHSTLHTGIKPFQCENCGNSFSCVGNLIKHRKTHFDTCGQVPLTTHRVQNPSTKIKVKINTPANVRLKNKEKSEKLQQEIDYLKTELEKNQTDKFANFSEIYCDEKILVKEEPFPTENLIEQRKNEDIASENTNSDNDENENEPVKRQTRRKKYQRKDPNYKKTLEAFVVETNFAKDGYGDCKLCGKRYINPGWFYKHVKDHEANGETPLHKCSCCKMTFHSKTDCLIHQQTTHADILTCQDCEKIFANKDSLRSHQNVFHKGISRKIYSYICDECGKQFKQKSNLECHKARNCDKGPLHECPVCNKQFSSKHTRNNHMRVHDPEKKLLCKFCAKSFHWKGQLKIHERSHTGEKPFACLYCPKAFAYRESLMTHSTIHTGIKPHLCEGCGSRFSCIGNLIKHRSSHASECGAWTYKSQTVPNCT